MSPSHNDPNPSLTDKPLPRVKLNQLDTSSLAMMMQLRQHQHVVPSSTQVASPLTSRRGIFSRRSPGSKKTRKYNTKEDRTLRALEAIRLLSFDIHTDESSKKSSPLTPRTVTTIHSDDTTEEESYEYSRTLKKPTAERPKLQVLHPLPMIDRNSSGETNRTYQRSDSNISYLSDTSSEIGDWPSVGDEQDYPRYICISHTPGGCANDDYTLSSSSRYSQLQQTNSRRLSVTAVEEWNRRCEEECGVFRRETYTSEILTKQSPAMNHRQHLTHHESELVESQKSCFVSHIGSDYFSDFSFDETEDDDISLTYSHDE